MRLYGDANNLPGLATGPIETRFARLREHASADSIVLWTTPTRWAGGEGLSLRFPDLRLEFACTLGDGHLAAVKVAQVQDDARAPDRESGAVGLYLDVDHLALPPEQAAADDDDPGVALLEAHFARLAGRRWGGFVEPLRAALEAEAREDEARTQRLTVPYTDATLVHGGEEDAWRLGGIAAEALHAYDDGEWLEVLDAQGRAMSNARAIRPRPSDGSMEVGIRSAADPPRAGFIRPRSRRKILEQKRALLDELESPTGSLPHLVRLVAAPGSMPMPHGQRPERFVNSAVMRNRSQARAVGLALGLEEGQAMLIQGPPGTGKSTTAAEIDVQLILRDPAVRILVCSHSNHGTDNMLMKVLPFLEDAQERIARIGFYDRIAREARPYYAPPDADLGDRNIIFTTIDALALQDIAGATVYDYVILDEANRAGVLDSLLALARGKRMILVGDAMQLQPVMSEVEQKMVAAGRVGRNGRPGGRDQAVIAPAPGPNNVIGKSLFAWIQERRFSPSAVVLLDQQNRMHPAIGELVSRVFYGGKVRTGPAAPRRGTGVPVFSSPVTWVDTRSLRGNTESRAGGTSVFNVAEGRLVTSVTRFLISHAPPQLTIGIIAAYAEQKELLRRMMGPREAMPAERELEIDTVDAFEGREKDIIVLSLVRSNRRRDVGFLRLEQRLNVAVSRARRLIIVVGDTSTLRGGYFNQLIPTASSVGQIVAAPKLLGQIGGRGQQRRERPVRGRRDERERPVAATVEGAPAPAEGQVLPPVATGEQPGTPVMPGEGRRRRRRRAWDRRRERLRVSLEQGQPEELTAGEAAPTVSGGVFSPDDEPPPYTGQAETAETSTEGVPLFRRRRHLRRRLRRERAGESEAVEAGTPGDPEGGPTPVSPRLASGGPAPAQESEEQPALPVASPATPAPRRGRVRAAGGATSEPASMDVPAAEPLPQAAPTVEAPTRRGSRTAPAPTTDTPAALSLPEPSLPSAPESTAQPQAPGETTPRRTARSRKVLVATPAVEAAPEAPPPPSELPATARTRRTRSTADPTTEPPAVLDTPAPKRRTRKPASADSDAAASGSPAAEEPAPKPRRSTRGSATAPTEALASGTAPDASVPAKPTRTRRKVAAPLD